MSIGADHGPWDSGASGAPTPTEVIDLGSLRVPVTEGVGVRVTKDPDGSFGALLLTSEDSAIELRAFADSRSGGLWDEVRASLAEQVQAMEGAIQEVDGSWGTELHTRVPVTLPDGSSAVQPSRIVGVSGPRWFLRATFFGRAAVEGDDATPLSAVFHDVVVHRGSEARPVREPLPLTPKDDLLLTPASPDPDEE